VTVELGIVDRVAALHRIDLFSATPGRVLMAVARAADDTVVEAGDLIIREGDVEDHLYAIVEGLVRVERAGRGLVELGPGSTVGELAALVPEPRAASVVAVERTRLLSIRKTVLDELLADWPELATSVIRALVARLRASAGHIGAADRAP
jgi:CRP/FNR family cyclic AMP-dependent transcriptional regulator